MTPTIPQSPAAQAASYHPTALISGGSSGIGLELAKLFARDGYRLVLVAHNEAKLAAAAGQLRASYGVDVRTVSQDLSVAALTKGIGLPGRHTSMIELCPKAADILYSLLCTLPMLLFWGGVL